MNIHHRTILLAFISLLCIVSCDDPSGIVQQGYDRKSMLEFTEKQTIIPLLTDVHVAMKKLDSTLIALDKNRSEGQAQAARDAWRKLAIAWQYAVIFDFGPAEMNDGSLFQQIGTFPVSTIKVDSYISAQDSTFQNFDRDARGLYALEYILFKDSTSCIHSFEQQPFRIAYARAMSRNMLSRLETVLDQWQHAYGISFIQSDGVQAGSSISDLYNAFVYHYEVMKNYNLGLPMGKRAGQIKNEPTKVEGYFSGSSVTLLKAKYEAIKYLWYGYARLSLATSLSPRGFKDYIETVELGPRLIQDTEAQWNEIDQAFSAIDSRISLQELIQLQSPALDTVFTALTKQTRFLKSEMSSLLGISITYSSSDGD